MRIPILFCFFLLCWLRVFHVHAEYHPLFEKPVVSQSVADISDTKLFGIEEEDDYIQDSPLSTPDIENTYFTFSSIKNNSFGTLPDRRMLQNKLYRFLRVFRL
jgi:hypothetical protein